MKRLNKPAKMFLALISVISIFTACGKSNTTTPGSGVIGNAAIIGGGVLGANGCVQLTNTTNGIYGSTTSSQALSFAISGSATVGYGGFSAQTTISGSGFSPITNSTGYYSRTNSTGDQLTITLSANSLQGQVTLSPSTVSAVSYYGGGVVCGVLFNNTGVSGSQLYGGMYLLGQSGPIATPYGYIQL